MLNPVPIGPKALLIFIAAIFIILHAQQAVRQVLLRQPVMGRVVGVLVELALALHLGGIVMLVLQVSGDGPGVSLS